MATKKSTTAPPMKYMAPKAAPAASPMKYMTPPATDSGFKMSMGSKENISEGNFSQKDNELISSAPSIMKDDWGGETIEMKDQESPLDYKSQSMFRQNAPSRAAWHTKMGDKRTEQNTQGLQNAIAIGGMVTDVASAFMGGGGGGKNKKDD